jgi:hypothetical protein
MARLNRDERPTAEKMIGAMTMAASATMSEKMAIRVKRKETRFTAHTLSGRSRQRTLQLEKIYQGNTGLQTGRETRNFAKHCIVCRVDAGLRVAVTSDWGI